MNAAGVGLAGFAFGESLEGPQRRSLGFRLLAPQPPAPWSAEVEALARRLQAAPYPDHWPPTALFCSVLLAGGERLIAVARYGLSDHTPSHRRSGLELFGVVGPADVGVPEALAVYRWLKQRRESAEGLERFGEAHDLERILAEAPTQTAQADPLPVLPIRLWQDGAVIFAATAPAEPDQRLGLLEQGSGPAWQWLPLIGSDFPLLRYAQLGPLVAWTPHLSGVAVKLDHHPVAAAPHGPTARPRHWPVVAVGLAVAGLLTANLAMTADLRRRLATEKSPQAPVAERPAPPAPATPEPSADAPADRLAEALYHHLADQGVLRDLPPGMLRRQYEQLAAKDETLRVQSEKGQLALGALAHLARRSPGQVEAAVREALANKGYDPALVNLITQRVRQRLADEHSEP
jgi:hypothetical protein